MSSEPSETAASTSRGRGRGRGKSRGGLGKYLRARGRGRGLGRPAEFGKRLVLEDEEEDELDPESEEAKEFGAKYSRRQLGTNADRYKEPEPELNSDGEVEQEPEVDLSSFLERQRLSPGPSTSPPPLDDDDIDTSLAHLATRTNPAFKSESRKGRVTQIEWDEELEKLSREKAAADATRDLKTRFRAKSEKIRNKPLVQGQGSDRDRKTGCVEAPPLPNSAPQKEPKDELQDFLDDLLN
ncbi:hypothetical protein PLICRDRAFT_442426 [Plicaturopsis crispa FD-325 SS-3]|uniref:Uncharacterized protein n=1 Tax=Plicaturopsis crispa FD-325 SS-3 TaxID=944288 RepID=A0A0C9SKI7_PLICR|nr:hypothetical protein PLICRDRAFT_442426 [Plicaturopsis crispa FD-325 SS-3]